MENEKGTFTLIKATNGNYKLSDNPTFRDMEIHDFVIDSMGRCVKNRYGYNFQETPRKPGRVGIFLAILFGLSGGMNFYFLIEMLKVSGGN